MLILALSIPIAFLAYKKVKLLPDHVKTTTKIIVSFLISLVLCLLVGAGVTELYYATELPEVVYEEIDVHFKTPLSIEQYVKQETVVLMDKEYNLYHIDVDDAEITFSSNNDAAFIKTIKAKSLWKLIVLDQSRMKYALQFYDSYSRYGW